MGFSIIDGEKVVPILIEENTFSGIRKIANVVAEDIFSVCGRKPEIIDEHGLKGVTGRNIIICGVWGQSDILSGLAAEGKFKPETVSGKWEVYSNFFVEHPFEGIDRALVIAGSDKRGAIYGLFSLSEYAGVTAFEYFGDTKPVVRDNIVIEDDFIVTSKEPSVRYRGFFINDEWPCFGTWVSEHFGGFNARAYEKIFIFLLRMKGNYLWPAMWSASFPLDGPGSANEELADELGVVMGYSHHEPCLRASEEWDKVRGVNTKYGNEWNYATNKDGLINYWKDALIRSGKYDNLITIGMRGERDTSMLGDNSTMRENVELLKEIITAQKELIRQYVVPHRDNPPMLLALYKEVEQYYYGDDEIEGLAQWHELDDVICMLCEDNFGYTRTLPTEKMRMAGKKFGMYYHLDYHGGPVSYEWVDSTPFSLIWEQMCQVYDSGIRDVWIVNVGDVKFHEVPLSYFMALAYDYDKWGSGNLNSYQEYIEKWCSEVFAPTDNDTKKKLGFVLDEYIKLNYLRRPEALNSEIYSACNFNEADRILERVDILCRTAEEVMDALDENEKQAFYSMVYYPAKASMNNIKLHLYAGKNHHYAAQGRTVANRYKKLAEECLWRDREYIKEFAQFSGGKWNGMQLASHIGFTKWNDDGCRMPVLCETYPVSGFRMNVSRNNDKAIYDKVYGPPKVIEIDDFMYAGHDKVTLEIANDGDKPLHYNITGSNMEIPDWLSLSSHEGDVDDLELVDICYLNEKAAEGDVNLASLKITDGSTTVIVNVSARRQEDTKNEEGCVFLSQKNTLIMRADHYYSKCDKQAGWRVIEGYGKYGVGLKNFPVTYRTSSLCEAPSVSYCFDVERDAEYTIRFFMTPTNPVIKGQRVMLACRVHRLYNETDYSEDIQDAEWVEVLPDDYRAGDNSDVKWCRGVLSQIRTADMKKTLRKGRNLLTIYATEPGMVLQQIGVYSDGGENYYAYLGQRESKFTSGGIQ